MECLETKNETETICVYVEAPLIACFPNAQYIQELISLSSVHASLVSLLLILFSLYARLR